MTVKLNNKLLFLTEKGAIITDERKRSHLQTDLYDINGKRVLVQRIPGLSDFWADASPAGKVFTVILIAVIILVYGIMEHFDLKFGSSVASETQMKLGSFAPVEMQTGPKINYWAESWEMVRTEAARLDTRIRKEDVRQETSPAQYPMFYPNLRDTRSGYLSGSGGQFQWFFSYLVRNGKHYERISGFSVVYLIQEPVGFMVRQKWEIKQFVISNRYLN